MKSTVCITFLFLCVVFNCKSQEMLNPHRGERYKEGTFLRVEDMAVKHILKTTHVWDNFECMADCMSHTTCQSFNFQMNGSPKHLCELSDIAILSSPNCQTSRPGFSYFYAIQQSKSQCSEDKDCKNGGTCASVCGNIGKCKCQAFNKGENCEEWTVDISSCKDIFSKTSYRTNMAYTFSIDNKPTDIYCHLTNDICGGGGWTLAMKIDDSTTQAKFGYSAGIWANKQSYNLTAGQTGFDNYQTKMPSYWAMPFDKLCVGFKFNNVLKWIVIPYKASSLYDVIADGTYRPTSISKSTWMSLIGGASLQPNCNQQGFNVYSYTRLGIRSNQENNCNSCDSALGLGINRHYSCGNYCGSSYCSNSGKTLVAFGYLMIQ